MHHIKKFFANSKVKSALLLIITIIVLASLISYNPADPSFNLATDNSPSNFLSYFGSYLADSFYQLVGASAFLLPICTFTWSVLIFRHGIIGQFKAKRNSLNIMIFTLRFTSMLLSIIFLSIASVKWQLSLLQNTIDFPAGIAGSLGILLMPMISNFLDPYLVNNSFFSTPSELISYICLAASILFLIFALGIRFRSYISCITKLFSLTFQALQKAIQKTGIIQKVSQKLDSFDSGSAYYPEENFSSITVKSNDVSSSFEEERSKASLFSMEKTEKAKEKRVAKAAQNQKPTRSYSQKEGVLPDIDLLDDSDNQSVKPQSQSELIAKSDELISVLQDFGVKGKMNEAREGPVVTMYEFEPAAGTKSSRVIGLADDIARSLSALSTRISVIPGKNALGMELPNKKRMFFRLKDLLKTPEFQNQNIALPIVLGKDLGGSPLVADLAKMPHLLVAGTTGSGKSVAINTMIMSLLYRYTPEECRMIMIDPKMLELSAYDDIPHLLTPVVTEPGKAVVALKWAVKEMENRYRLMSHLGVRNINNYNARIDEAISKGEVIERKIQTGFDPETGEAIYERVAIDMNKMPFIVVIVDEMADLMLVAGKDIESSIQRLAQMARAAGIHIIMATQRPSVDVITGVIKANFPSRISFKVTSKIDSRTILGEQGAEQLLGMGDMLYMGNSSRILRVHGPFVDDKEVERVTNFLRENGKPEYVSSVTEAVDEDSDANNSGEKNGESDIYTQAVNIVRTERKASISYIQRSLRIGYNKAANLVEEMEKNGILSKPNHSGKREILLPED